MRGIPDHAWGKLKYSESGEVESWHPLAAHCADVAACCEALLRRSLTGKRLAGVVSQDQLSDVQIARLSVLAGLHDIGKFNTGFQNREHITATDTAGHVREMLALMTEEGSWTEKLADALEYRRMLEWVTSERTLFSYLNAVVAHHGRPQVPGVFRSALWKQCNGYDPFTGISELREMLQEWYPDAWHESGELLPAESAFQHAFYGLVTLADWIGSDEHLFPYTDDFNIGYITTARSFAEKALSLLWLEPGANCNRYSAQLTEFNSILPDCEPRPVQRAVIELDSPVGGAVAVIEAETGSGKTEAAIACFMRLFRNGLVDGLYFALPTRTAATQIHKRVNDIIRRVFSSGNEAPPVVMAVPGYLRVDDHEGMKLAPFSVRWDDDNSERSRYRSWAAERSKRYLAGTIVVGTVDQVLLSALQVNHSHMRAASLLRHLLVVDEVHASDLYMNQLLKVVLDRHVQAGGYALLMSATLGTETAAKLLGRDRGQNELKLSDAIHAPYPQISICSAGGNRITRDIPRSGSMEKIVRINIETIIANPSEVARIALDFAEKDGRIIIIRNTVDSCLCTQREIERIALKNDNGNLLHQVKGLYAPHHARFARLDRILLDNELKNHFGKERPSGGRIALATQTVQQSLDLDADLMITDLCPMDVLLQRIGRLHRHHRIRPSAFLESRIIVLVPEDRDITSFLRSKGEARGAYGIGTVYEDLRILEATWRALEQRSEIRIPDDNRMLVETSLHSSVLRQISEEKGGLWKKHQQYIDGSSCAKRLLADLNISNWSVDFVSEKVLFSSSGDRHLSTRLGSNDRLAVFRSTVISPFGNQVRELPIPGWMAGDVPDDAAAEDVLSANHVVTFRFGDKQYEYDRMGLRTAGMSNIE
ncbi:MAG: CRISPR-associated helicase Cas3' [Candidatus Fermentibacteraceae bacterium]|nr:CRISPR-associated helicase Cas3' [Candidatus Fermentibacteraceae bacterium]MBN2609317.1 CRISPR-associated helicase Cas3' [Candidatus Fermentibacteraceae bacterium]